MRKFTSVVARVVLPTIAIVLVGTKLVVPVRADASSGWLSQAAPALANTAQLADSTPPGFSNQDCTQQAYNLLNAQGNASQSSGCLAQSVLGEMGLSGSPFMQTGTSLAYNLTPYYPYLVQPIQNQAMMLSVTSAPVVGSYLHFYRDIRQEMTETYSPNGPFVGYTITKQPDFDFRDRTNKLVVTNVAHTLSYSSDGSWMVVDLPGAAFVRVNLATFDVLPFAPSVGSSSDLSRNAETAISDDGKYAAIASDDFTYLRVFDLTTCTGTIKDDYSQPLSCQYRDYWPSMNTQVSGGLKTIYAVRFVNDDNLSVTATYNWQSRTSYKVAKFTLTAPGKEAHSLDYLALGDSYISGQGEFQYKAGTDTDINACHLSPLSYPFILGAELFNQYNSAACSGAVTVDISNQSKDYKGQVSDGIKRRDRDSEPILSSFSPGYIAQWEFIQKYQPRVVTLSIGGNDIGFADIVTKCVSLQIVGKDCYNSYDERMNLVKRIDSAYANLIQTYQLILQKDPGVQLYVIGYPQVVATPNTINSCGVNVHLNPKDIAVAQSLIAYLDSTIHQAADSVGARYVDTEYALAGHRLCEASATSIAMNGVTAGNDSGALGLKMIGNESFHPNVFGHQLLAQAILSQTNNLKQAMPVADTSIVAPNSTDPLAQVLLSGYPPSGHTTPAVISVGNSIRSAYRGIGSTITLDSSYGLQPNTTYHTVFDDVMHTTVGDIVTDSSGNLSLNFILPQDTSTGFHVLSVQGINVAGQTMQVDTAFYVAASATDLNGDGVPDTQSSCFLIPPSGADVDGDGMDDACDPVIAVASQQDYLAKVYLKNNTILITRP